ncbi:MAG: hypothetical protein WAX04_13790 [Oscillospiraceae bacterium]
MARDTRISVKVTKYVRNELEQVALSYGLTISSLGAFIVGQWLENNKVNNNDSRLSGATAVNCLFGGPGVKGGNRAQPLPFMPGLSSSRLALPRQEANNTYFHV